MIKRHLLLATIVVLSCSRFAQADRLIKVYNLLAPQTIFLYINPGDNGWLNYGGNSTNDILQWLMLSEWPVKEEFAVSAGTPPGASEEHKIWRSGSNYIYPLTYKKVTNLGPDEEVVLFAPDPPEASTNVVASDGTYTNEVRVTWSAGYLAWEYEILRSTNSNRSVATNIYHYTVPTNLFTNLVFQCSDTSAIPGITYFYWIRSINYGGITYSVSNTGYRAESPPGPPSGVTATDGTYKDRVAVSWVAVANATGYQVWRGNSASTNSASRIASVNSVTNYDDYGTTNGITIFYWIKATNSVGTSGFSPSDSGFIPVMNIVVNPAAQTNWCFYGQNATSQTFSITNSGGGSLSYTIADDVPWILSITPSSGTATGANNNITIDYLTAEMNLGSYTGIITVTAIGATNSPKQLPVYLHVTGPIIGVSTSRVVTISPEKVSPSDQAVEIWNAGIGSLNYTVSNTVGWLSVIPSNGSSTGQHNVLTLKYTTAGLSNGLYSNDVLIYGADATNSPFTISVEHIVTNEFIVDNSDGVPYYIENGSWYASSSTGFYKSDSRYSLSAGSTARWTPRLPVSGLYKVYAWWPATPTRSTAVPYRVSYLFGVIGTAVNQQTNGSSWNYLGLFGIDMNAGAYVEVECPPDGQAGADAVKYEFFSEYSWDTDQDGMKDIDELYADTNPTNPASFFPPLEIYRDGMNLCFRYNETSPNRFYYIDEAAWLVNTTNPLLPPPWTNIFKNAGVGEMNVEYIMPDVISRFYRGRVRMD